MIPTATLIQDDCLNAMRQMPDASIDAIITDPPYGLSFMGKKWDYDVPSVEIWAECLRVLKPGGHLLAFAGTRTQHRMAVRIEDAGFEIRDMIAWIYGSGFPKSLDVSKAIDREAGAENDRHFLCVNPASRPGNYGSGVIGQTATTANGWRKPTRPDKTAPATPAARQWQGWGTALKPALEPITVARKPLVGTVAENVLAHGTGALNIDGCRVKGEPVPVFYTVGGAKFEQTHTQPNRRTVQIGTADTGRWPANLIHDGSEEVVGLFPHTTSGKPMNKMHTDPGRNVASGASEGGKYFHTGFGDSGSAARFFYCAKAASNERLSFLTCNCQTVKHCSWVKLDQNQNAQTHSTSPAPDTSEETSQDDLFSSTSPSGKPKTAQSKRDTSSTTSTETGKTTASKISNSSHQQNTSESTEDAKSGTENGSSHAVFAGDRFQSMPGTSICLQKDGRFMGVVANATSPLSSGISECEGCGTKIQRTAHPTQKPEDLMRYLCRLVTPPGGTVLDPFMGSGSTGKAAIAEGFNFIGIERDPQYFQIAQKRATTPPQTTLPLQ